MHFKLCITLAIGYAVILSAFYLTKEPSTTDSDANDQMINT